MPAELLAYLARELVDEPDAVRVETEERDDALVLLLHVAPDDVGTPFELSWPPASASTPASAPTMSSEYKSPAPPLRPLFTEGSLEGHYLQLRCPRSS